MGNLFSSQKYNLNNYNTLKEELGSLDEPEYPEENRPNSINIPAKVRVPNHNLTPEV